MWEQCVQPLQCRTWSWEQCTAVWESTWLQSIFDQDPLTGHPPLLQGDTPINNWTRENNPAKSKTPLFNWGFNLSITRIWRALIGCIVHCRNFGCIRNMDASHKAWPWWPHLKCIAHSRFIYFPDPRISKSLQGTLPPQPPTLGENWIKPCIPIRPGSRWDWIREGC